MRIGMPGVMMGCTLAAALAVAGPAGAQIDGSVTYNMPNAAEGRTLVMHFHGSQEAVEIPGGMGTMIMDASTGTRTVLMHQQKMYMQMNATDMPQPTLNNKADLSMTKEGSETVAGIPCTDYKISGTNTAQDSYEICVAPGVPSMDPKLLMGGPMGARTGFNPQIASIMAQLRGQGALKVSKIDGANKTVILEATKVDRTPPDPTIFQIPPGYTKFQAPPGMQMPGMAQPGTGQPKSPQ